MENSTEKPGPCHHCKHYVRRDMRTRWSNTAEGYIEEEKTPRHCAIGNNERLDKWWEENGHKRNPEELDKYDCFERPESTKALDEMLRLTGEMLELLKASNKEEGK